MSTDAVVVLAVPPEEAMVIAALNRAVPTYDVQLQPDGGLDLFLPTGAWAFSIDTPLLVQVPGEGERLLGNGPPVPQPGWWIECRGNSREPDVPAALRLFVAALCKMGKGTPWMSR